MRTYGQGHFLTVGVMEWSKRQYFASPDDAHHPYASPLRADLAGLPPALVLVGECDPLHDQAEAYARALEAAGVPVVLERYPGAIHPFFSLGGIVDAGRAAIRQAAEALRAAAGM